MLVRTKLVPFLLLTECSHLKHSFSIATFYLYMTWNVTEPSLSIHTEHPSVLEIVVISDQLTSLEISLFRILIAPNPINQLAYVEKLS